MRVVRELTPVEVTCGVGACPAVFETDRNSVLIVGRSLSVEEIEGVGLSMRVAEGESVVEIPKNILGLK